MTSCLGTTRKGLPCRNRAQAGESFCGPHLTQLWPTEWEHDPCGERFTARTETRLRELARTHVCGSGARKLTP